MQIAVFAWTKLHILPINQYFFVRSVVYVINLFRQYLPGCYLFSLSIKRAYFHWPLTIPPFFGLDADVWATIISQKMNKLRSLHENNCNQCRETVMTK